jgi:tetratricopeptide (TPR) repeat protein
VQYQVTCSRHQVADSLVQLSRFAEARALLEQTVAKFTTDAQVALAIGSFLLRIDFFRKTYSRDFKPKGGKESQIQLLKAANLDGSKASPFALLGYWYKRHGDAKQAIRCYSKALGGGDTGLVFDGDYSLLANILRWFWKCILLLVVAALLYFRWWHQLFLGGSKNRPAVSRPSILNILIRSFGAAC